MSRAILILALIVVLLVVAPLGAAQDPPPPKGLVIHLWVDPHYGNDLLATQNNPSLTHSTGWKPHDVQDPAQNSAPLLHASWPFKTINGANGAIKYLQSTTLLNVLPLPNTSTVTGNVWEYAIIHLMPGMYGPGVQQGIIYNGFNGLPENGESFPITLPDRVSIQGASALNTLISPASTTQAVGPAFDFGLTTTNTGTGSFIDSVSIFGASRSGTAIFNEVLLNVIGIYMGPSVACKVTISNCFIFGNEVGICLDADGLSETPEHEPLLVNNTIAWNTIGLWNGQINNPQGSTGVSTPIVINNIFDATPGPSCPRPQWRLQSPFLGIATSDFEGLCSDDMRITQPTTGNFNAFERGTTSPFPMKYNFGPPYSIPPFLVGPSLPPTVVRPTSTTPSPAPSRNIDDYTGGTNVNSERRGILYITDLICNGQAHGIFQPGANFDGSPMDFRLSPAVAKAGLDVPIIGKPWVPGGSNGALNPLVDNGFYWTFPPGVPIQMSNPTRSVSYPPGFLSLQNPGFWPYHSWDEDCEGYGNPRVVDHREYTSNNGYAPEGEPFIDIGADELGDLIVAGYRHGTTHFISVLGKTGPQSCNSVSSPMDNKYLWYLGRPDVKAPQPPTIWPQKPQHLVVTGFPNAPPSTPYPTPPWYDLWTFIPGGVQQTYYGPASTDITPHLAPDIHPWWKLPTLLPPLPSNPLWVPGSPLYNWHLYWNPTAGVINPPGTHSVTGPNNWSKWLDGLFPSSTYNCIGLQSNGGRSPICNQVPGPTLGGPTQFSTMDLWCRANDSNTPSPRFMETFAPTGPCKTGTACSPTFGGTGGCIVSLRYSLEVLLRSTFHPPGSGKDLKNSNIQSFIVIVEQQ